MRHLALFSCLVGMCSVAPAQNYIFYEGTDGLANFGDRGRTADGVFNSHVFAASRPSGVPFAEHPREDWLFETTGETLLASTTDTEFNQTGSGGRHILGETPATACRSVFVYPGPVYVWDAGGSQVVNVTTGDQMCEWSVTSLPPWIIPSPPSGIGPGTLKLTFLPNNGAPRSTTIVVNGRNVFVSQGPWPTSCGGLPGVNPRMLQFSATGGSQVVNVSDSFLEDSNLGCEWVVTDLPEWIRVVPMSGRGDGFLTLIVPANLGAARSVILSVGGLEVVVSQDASVGTVPGTSCSITAIPPTFEVGATSGLQTLDIIASVPSCSWSISNLPSWITATPISGTGSGTVTLTIAANSGAPRSALPDVSGTPFSVKQAPSTVWCGFELSPSGQGFSSAGGAGTIMVQARAGCPWSVVAPPSWVTLTGATSGIGPGTITFTVATDTATQRNATLQVGNATATIEQDGDAEGPAGVMGHFAAGEGWQTAFTLINSGYVPSHAQLDFFDNNGQALARQPVQSPYSSLQQPDRSSAYDNLFNPGALIRINAPAGASVSQTGWAQLMTDGPVSGFGVFSLPMSGGGTQEAVVPLESRSSSSFILPFDNTNGYFYGVAISNLSRSDALIEVVIRDAVTGDTIEKEQVSLAAKGHTQFVLRDAYPRTDGMRGTAEFRSTGFIPANLSVLGLRFNANYAFTSVPVFVRGTQKMDAPLANVGAMAHIAAGGGWSTLFTLINTGTATSSAHLSFLDDNGSALLLPVSLPMSPGTGIQSSAAFDQSLAPGAFVLVECSAPTADEPQTGWAQLQSDGSVTGFAVFQYTAGNVRQEAAVPLSALNTGISLLAFDNTNGYSNGVALANNSGDAVDVPVIVHDADTGNTVEDGTINLPAWGHTSFMLTDRFQTTRDASGTIEFVTPGSSVSVLGLRVNSNNAFTSIPSIAKK
jgi:hypothetical protein